MVIGYGYRRRETDLREIGCERVYVDVDAKRRERADMVELGLRPGDEVRVLYLRDLGGSPVADRIWRERIEALGATVTAHRPEKPRKPLGPPRKFDPSPEVLARCRAIWLDGTRSEKDRLAVVRDVVGHAVTRSTLNGRFGWPSRPKPEQQ